MSRYLGILVSAMVVALAAAGEATSKPPRGRTHVALGSPLLRAHVDREAAPAVERRRRPPASRLSRRTPVVEFRRPSDPRIEGAFRFPLPERAATNNLAMVDGEGVIEGQGGSAAQLLVLFGFLLLIVGLLIHWSGDTSCRDDRSVFSSR